MAAPKRPALRDEADRSHEGPLDRAIAILTFVAEQKKAVSAAEIAAALSLPLPTAHRLIGNLEQRGLVQKALGTKRYVVGNKLVALSAKAIGSAFRTARRHAVLSAVADQASNARSASFATTRCLMSTACGRSSLRSSNSIRAMRRRSTAPRPARST